MKSFTVWSKQKVLQWEVLPGVLNEIAALSLIAGGHSNFGWPSDTDWRFLLKFQRQQNPLTEPQHILCVITVMSQIGFCGIMRNIFLFRLRQTLILEMTSFMINTNTKAFRCPQMSTWNQLDRHFWEHSNKRSPRNKIPRRWAGDQQHNYFHIYS